MRRWAGCCDDSEQENIPAPGVQARQALGSLMALGREINHEIWTDSISTGKLTVRGGCLFCPARHDVVNNLTLTGCALRQESIPVVYF
ncbi:hypothetical protein O5631_04455 [Escherichia coli]|nr:hypothetical protein [Escherichia coli]